jgi:hypothetical protein
VAGQVKASRLVAVAVLLAGCRSGGTGATPAGSPPATEQATAQPTGLGGGAGEQAGPASSGPSMPNPSLSTAGNSVKEVPGSCPYISAARFADLEGDRVGRVTLLRSQPVGCRFYFEYEPATVVGEITVARFGTATEAYNAMVESAKGHPEVQSDAGIGAGAVAFQTPLQGSRSWQCVFAKGTSVVTVRTRQPYPALNAFLLARAIVPKIK